MTLILTQHAADRLAERFGWRGTPEDAAARLGEQTAVRIALALGIGDGKVVVPQLDITLYFRRGIVVTVAARSTQATHKARRESLARKTTKPGVRPRSGFRGRRQPRPEMAGAWDDE